MAEFLQIRFGAAHPLIQICREIRRDNEAPGTLEATIRLMQNVFEKLLGPENHETFQSHLALVVCQRQNLDFTAAE